MAEGNFSVVRVDKITASGAQKVERHNERKNESYGNLNVDTERIPLNVHYKDTGGLTYNELFQKLIDEGKISTRGQKEGATILNEMVVDVNTRYFEDRGGYEYAKRFYEEAYRFACGVYGEENIVSAVMHADELNKAVSEEMGKPVYHYHLHVVAIPTVKKEIRWSKRCKDEALRGTVKEVINQVSHSKKWTNTIPVLDEKGKQAVSKYGKPVFRKSYSVAQDQLFEHMTAAGFTGFERGEMGSTAEHLSSLDYQIEKDKERLASNEERIASTEEKLADTEERLADTEERLADTEEQIASTEGKLDVKKKELAKVSGEVKVKQKIATTYGEIEAIGSKGITGKYTVTKQELDNLKELAMEGVASRSEIGNLKRDVDKYKNRITSLNTRLVNVDARLKEVTEKYEKLTEVARPYLLALQHFPDRVKDFFDRLFPSKDRAEERQEPRPTRKPKTRDDWAR